MSTNRGNWNDGRLDDLKSAVDSGFKEVNGRIDRVDARIDRVDGRIDKLQQAMIIGVVAICTMMFAGFGAMITLFATHF